MRMKDRRMKDRQWQELFKLSEELKVMHQEIKRMKKFYQELLRRESAKIK